MSNVTISPNRYPVLGGDAPDSIRLGRYVDPEKRAIAGRMAYSGERNAIIFGPNGSGKGTRILVPNLLQSRDRSIFVIDPKGELAAITAPFRRTLGQVVIINPFGVLADRRGYEDLKSCGYNPLAKLNPASTSFNREAAQLAEALISINEKDPHWDTSARALVAAIIMYVVMEARHVLTPEVQAMAGVGADTLFRDKSLPTMARVRELLCLASEKDSAANDFRGSGIPALALAMMKTGLPGLRNKASQFTKWTNEIQSVASAARAQTEPFDDYEIAADLAKDGFRLSTMKKEPVTVYLIIPPEEMDRHSKWLRLIVTAAFQSVLRVREPHEPKVLFMLDEFAALGHMQIIETVWALVRGYGIQILPVFQDLNQLKGIYKDRWETFIGMAGAALSFGPNDLTTAGWISARAGEKTARIQNTTFSDSTSGGHSPGGATSGWSVSRTDSLTDTQVPFVRAHTLFGMKEGATLSFLAGLEHIVPGYAPPYWDIEECHVRARPNPYVAKSGNAPPSSVYVTERRGDGYSQYLSSDQRLPGFPEKIAIQWAPLSALQAYSSSDTRFSVLGEKIADRLQ